MMRATHTLEQAEVVLHLEPITVGWCSVKHRDKGIAQRELTSVLMHVPSFVAWLSKSQHSSSCNAKASCLLCATLTIFEQLDSEVVVHPLQFCNIMKASCCGTTYEPFLTIKVPLTGRTVQQCLDGLESSREICSNCDCAVKPVMTVHTAPAVLIINLGRFMDDGSLCDKEIIIQPDIVLQKRFSYSHLSTVFVNGEHIDMEDFDIISLKAVTEDFLKPHLPKVGPRLKLLSLVQSLKDQDVAGGSGSSNLSVPDASPVINSGEVSSAEKPALNLSASFLDTEDEIEDDPGPPAKKKKKNAKGSKVTVPSVPYPQKKVALYTLNKSIEETDIKEVLNGSPLTKTVLENYDAEKGLSAKGRSLVVQKVADYLLNLSAG
ncbi:hypothetical protein FOCC_FOCC015914 [Frankliniella occidentalis]|nr:hypothetical protein FOCC_FOCC015914 [Frankliniella occidentalis]